MKDSAQGCGSRLTRLAAGALAAVFVLASPPAALVNAAGRVLFSSERMGKILTAQLVDTGALEKLVMESMLQQANFIPDSVRGEGPGSESAAEETDGRAFLSYLGENERRRIVEIVLPQEWTRAQIEILVDSFYSWIEGPETSPQVELELEPLRQRLLEGGLEEIIEILFASWPACTQEQLAQMPAVDQIVEGVALPVCSPPEPARREWMAFANAGFRQRIEAGPLAISPGGEGGDGLELDPQAAAMKVPLRILRLVTRWVWLAPAFLLVMILVLAVRSWRDLARLWGAPILFGGLLTLALGLVASTLVQRGLNLAFVNVQAPASAVDLVRGISAAVWTQVFVWTLGAGAGLTVLGVGLRWASRSRPGKSKRPADETPAETHADSRPADPEAPDEPRSPSGMFG